MCLRGLVWRFVDIASCFITVTDQAEPYSLRAVARTRLRDGPTREMA